VSIVVPLVFILVGLGGAYSGFTDKNWLMLFWSGFILIAGIAGMMQMHGIVQIPQSRRGVVDEGSNASEGGSARRHKWFRRPRP
jgi:hypothetical protein